MKTASRRTASRVPRRWLWVVGGVMLLVLWWRGSRPVGSGPSKQPDPDALRRVVAQQVLEIEAREQAAVRSVYAADLLAQQCGEVFDDLWDALNRSTNRWEVAAGFAGFVCVLPALAPAEEIGWGIRRYRSSREAGAGREVDAVAWARELAGWRDAGWLIEQLEFRHIRFEPAAAGRAARSVFQASVHLVQAGDSVRATVEGPLRVEWADESASAARPRPARIDASELVLQVRSGPPPFRNVMADIVSPEEGSHFIDPVLVQDLDGNGIPEIVLAAANRLYAREPDGSYRSMALCRHWPGKIFTAVLGDFTGDGHVDLAVVRFEGVLLFVGSAGGSFPEEPLTAWSAPRRLRYAQALTAGDADGDGDLDLWLGQYKVPYEAGQMPTPYHNANDGHPGYLLLNDGHSRFTDATEVSGLAAKRWRRMYGASWVDLDGDRRLDLITVSDFAGIDAFRNLGGGRFADVTREWFAEPRAFGMAHTLADFDLDGRLDVLMTGMNSPTAERLDHLGLARPAAGADLEARRAMIVGNRLYYGRADGRGFEEREAGRDLARSGWSWGSAALDADNDGWPDVHVVNGHISNASVRDYETYFWWHDIEVGSSQEDPFLAAYFGSVIARTRGRGWSYGGYEKNRLYLNRQGRGFVEAGHLFGLALETDCRNGVADDLDGDGREDLVVTTFEEWPVRQQTVRIYRNEFAGAQHWIGFRLAAPGLGVHASGAVVRLRAAGSNRIKAITTGDGYRSQQSTAVHFGLGALAAVDEVTIQWPDGRESRWERPAVDQWHRVETPRTGAP